MFVIYLVLLGDKYEGYVVLSAHTSHGAAKKFCVDFMSNDDLATVLGKWVEKDNNYWYRNHEYLAIREMEVSG